MLRLFRLDKPLELPADATKALGSLPWLPVVEQARNEQHAWVDAGAFFARDLPIWIAAGQIDSVQLANRHLLRGGVVANEAGGWPRDDEHVSQSARQRSLVAGDLLRSVELRIANSCHGRQRRGR